MRKGLRCAAHLANAYAVFAVVAVVGAAILVMALRAAWAM